MVSITDVIAQQDQLEEIRRNIEAAGFDPAERDGRFSLCA